MKRENSASAIGVANENKTAINVLKVPNLMGYIPINTFVFLPFSIILLHRIIIKENLY